MSDNATCEETGVKLAPAGLLSRAGKLMMGLLQIYLVFQLLVGYKVIFRESMPTGITLIIAVVLAFALLSWTINLGFQRRWGARPFYVALGAVGVAMALGYFMGGGFWGLPLASVLYGITVYVHGHMGPCHVLAAVMGTPGCEMRSPDHLRAMLQGKKAELHICPGFWTPLDEWEARIRGRGPRESTAVEQQRN